LRVWQNGQVQSLDRKSTRAYGLSTDAHALHRIGSYSATCARGAGAGAASELHTSVRAAPLRRCERGRAGVAATERAPGRGTGRAAGVRRGRRRARRWREPYVSCLCRQAGRSGLGGLARSSAQRAQMCAALHTRRDVSALLLGGRRGRARACRPRSCLFGVYSAANGMTHFVASIRLLGQTFQDKRRPSRSSSSEKSAIPWQDHPPLPQLAYRRRRPPPLPLACPQAALLHPALRTAGTTLLLLRSLLGSQFGTAARQRKSLGSHAVW